MTVVDGPEDVYERESTELTVEVRDEFDNPVSDVEVDAYWDAETDANSNDSDPRKTNSAGQATFKYEPDSVDGEEDVTVNASFVGDPDSSSFDASDPENVSVSFTVREDRSAGERGEEGAFSGQIEDSQNDDDVLISGDGLYRTVDTDEDGAYTVYGVPTGKYENVVAEIDDDDYESDTFTVTAGNVTNDVDFELIEIANGSFSGIVEDDSGNSIGETDVTFEADDGTFEETVETNADGEYTVEDVEEGTYDITASADGFGDDTVEDVEITAGEEEEGVDFTLSEVDEFSYTIGEVTAVSGGGNEIDVTADLQTDDPDAEVLVESVKDDGDIRDSTQEPVADNQPQEFTIDGANQADIVRVILIDGDGNETDEEVIVEYPTD